MTTQKLTTKQKSFVFWTIIFTVIGSTFVFISLYNRHRQLAMQRNSQSLPEKIIKQSHTQQQN